MPQKIPCNKCGAMILPVTAQITGGLCMPCKQGRRESIDAAKEFTRKAMEYDPHFALWMHVAGLADQDPVRLSKLTPEQQAYFTVAVFDGEVLNGGFEQFFSNGSGAYYKFVIDGLLELGEIETLKQLLEVKQLLFGNSAVPVDDEERNRLIDLLPEDEEEQIRIDQIYHTYCQDIDRMGKRLRKYAEDKGFLTPFLSEAMDQDR